MGEAGTCPANSLEGLCFRFRPVISTEAGLNRLPSHFPDQNSSVDATDGNLILLVQVTDTSGNAYRNFGILELDSLKPELAKGDVGSVGEHMHCPETTK